MSSVMKGLGLAVGGIMLAMFGVAIAVVTYAVYIAVIVGIPLFIIFYLVKWFWP